MKIGHCRRRPSTAVSARTSWLLNRTRKTAEAGPHMALRALAGAIRKAGCDPPDRLANYALHPRFVLTSL